MRSHARLPCMGDAPNDRNRRLAASSEVSDRKLQNPSAITDNTTSYCRRDRGGTDVGGWKPSVDQAIREEDTRCGGTGVGRMKLSIGEADQSMMLWQMFLNLLENLTHTTRQSLAYQRLRFLQQPTYSVSVTENTVNAN